MIGTRPRAAGSWQAVIAGLLAGLLGGIGSFLVLERTNFHFGQALNIPQPEADVSPSAAGSVAAVAEAALPAVVTVQASGAESERTGSGFVIDNSGRILTNNHVVEVAADAGQVNVVLADGSVERAEVLGRNATLDLAVLQVERRGLRPLVFGNSDSARIGDTAIALGSPLGLSLSVTTGIVSAVNRPVSTGDTGEVSYFNAIQTDAAINLGNSGGPLLNAAGEVIGVNAATATAQASGESEVAGLGFAIPSNEALRVARELVASGRSTTPVIGAVFDAAYVGGCRTIEVRPGGPADLAGLRIGDVVVGVNGRATGDAAACMVAVRRSAPGDVLVLRLSGGAELRPVVEGREEGG